MKLCTPPAFTDRDYWDAQVYVRDPQAPEIQEYQQWQKDRITYARIEGDPDLKERLNHYHWLDVSLWSQTDHMDQLVNLVADRMPGRTLQKRRDHLRVILANLVKLTGTEKTHDHYLAYYRKHKPYSNRPKRYNPAKVTRLTIDVVDDLISAGLIEHHQGQYSVHNGMGYVSKFRPTGDLLDLIGSVGIVPVMISRHPASELVVLKATKETVWKGKPTKTGGKMIDYKDTPDIEGMRAEIESYNDFLSTFDIRVPGLPKPEFTGVYRVFNNASWTSGGRYAGGWWMGISEDVRKAIQINRRPTIELDFRACLLTLLYAVKGLEPVGGGDPYYVEGIDRNIAKKASMRCLNNKGRQYAISGLERDLSEDYPTIWHLIDCASLVDKFINTHRAVSGDFFKGIGADLMYRESEICTRVIVDLMNQDICCLSIHDSFVVQKDYRDHLWKAMVEAFRAEMVVSYTPVITEG